jgi:hypothetical protein
MRNYAQRSALQLANRLFSHYRPPRRLNYENLRGKSIRGGLTAPKPLFSGPIFDYLALQAKNPKKNEEFEQWVAGYDPQLVAWQRPPLASFLSGTARGSSPEP